MKKSYFLTYGTNKSKEEIRDCFALQMDLILSERESEYVGEYFLYSGSHADYLNVSDNYNPYTQEWSDTVNKFKTLIFLSFINGKKY